MPSIGVPAADRARMREMDAEDDLRTITRAAEIHGDSKRLSHVQRVLRKQERGLRKVKRSLSPRSPSKGR